MKWTIFVLLFYPTLHLVVSVHATPLQAPSFFEQSLIAFEKQNYQKAHQHLVNASEIHPHSSAILYNLGLTQMHLQNPIPAIAYFRQAVYLNSWNFSAKKALDQLQKPLPLLFHIPQELFLFLLGFSLFLFVFSFSKWKIIFFIFNTGMFFWYTHTKSNSWNTVTQTTAVRTAPDEKALSIFELNPGDFIMILSPPKGQWIQVKNQNRLAGWVKTNHLFSFPTSSQ